MRLDQSKNWVRWAGLVCLTSTGCVHQQHQSADQKPFASAQSSLLVNASGQTSNTGRVAVVNDPNQWPDRPSDDHVKSRFTQLFPNLAQREDRPLKVQIGVPETITAQNNDPADQPQNQASENSNKLAEVTEVSIPKGDVAKTFGVAAEPNIDKSTWAKLSQHSAGAVSAVAALVATENQDQAQQTQTNTSIDLKVNEVERKPQVASVSPQAEPVKPSTDSIVINDASETTPTNRDLSDTKMTPPAVVMVPSIPSKPKRTEVPAEVAAKPSEVNPARPNVAEPVAVEPAKTLADSKPAALQSPKLQEVAPVPTPLPTMPEIPAIPIVTSIPNPVLPISKLPDHEPNPAVPADELLAKIEKPVNPEPHQSVESSIKELDNAPLIVPETPRIGLEVPGLPVQIVDKSETPATSIEAQAVDRLALAAPGPRTDAVAPALSEPKAHAVVPIQPEPSVKKTDTKLSVSSEEGSKLTLKEAISEPSKQATRSTDLPPPTPAPELQIPGLPDVPAIPVTAPESAPTSNSPSDKGVERSSGPVIEQAKPSDTKPLKVTASGPESEIVSEPIKSDQPANPALNQTIQDVPTVTEEAVPVLKPLPDESGAGKDDSVMVPEAVPQNRPGEIVIRVSLLNPFRKRSLMAQNEGRENPGSGLKSLRTAAGGLFDWRQKASSRIVESSPGNDLQMVLQSEGGNRRTAAIPQPLNHSEVSSMQPVNTDLNPGLAVKPVANPRQIASLPPIQFPASYTSGRTQSANPWVNHKVPAIDLVGRPLGIPKDVENRLTNQVKVSPDLGVAQPRSVRDVTVQQTSMTALTMVSVKPAAIPGEFVYKTTENSMAPSWWARTSKGLRSIWTDEDEVVPPKRQNWAGGDMSLTK